jgi:hypothetical protein
MGDSDSSSTASVSSWKRGCSPVAATLAPSTKARSVPRVIAAFTWSVCV